ncbi:alpha/beta hydrolase family protein [Paeniglutamicibacter sp. NPDC012692]|uniref:alpha/beta hydrolase family protein n=1 Tax=Paeniglutamicibacter sp. NPDC012692 TaxID=3364388 RepID=UPI0036B18036
MNRHDITYGPEPDQHIQCHAPSGTTTSKGLAILVHGGYWRSRFTASLMDAMVSDLLDGGWAVANVEYRRGSENSTWPEPAEDVALAIETLANSQWAGGPRIAIGHSVGGQLALLANAGVDAVVALAPLTDITRTRAEGLGDGAVSEYFGNAEPATYRGASPIHQLPLTAPVLVVHGVQDDRVPVEHSRDFVAAALAARSEIEIQEHAAMDHIGAIDPKLGHWAGVLEWMDARTRACNSANPAASGNSRGQAAAFV